MIKVLHSADFHLGAHFSALPEDRAKLRRLSQFSFLDKLLELSVEESVDLLLLAGDLFDRPEGDPESLERLQAFTEQVRVPVLISPGNHDYLMQNSPYIRNRWPENVHIFKSNQLEKVSFTELGCDIWGAGYEGIDCDPLLRDFQGDGENPVRMILLHGDPVHQESPYCPVTRAQVRNSGVDYLAMGHIHRAGGFQVGASFCAWPGCPVGRGFDETGIKGAILAEIEPGQVRSRLVQLTSATYEDVTVTVGEDPMPQILTALPAFIQDSVCRVTLEGSTSTASADQIRCELERRCFHLVLRDHRKPIQDLWYRAGKDTLEGALLRILRETSASSDETVQEQADLAARICQTLLDGKEVELP